MIKITSIRFGCINPNVNELKEDYSKFPGSHVKIDCFSICEDHALFSVGNVLYKDMKLGNFISTKLVYPKEIIGIHSGHNNSYIIEAGGTLTNVSDFQNPKGCDEIQYRVL